MGLYMDNLEEDIGLEKELDQMLTVAEAADLLGVSKVTVRRFTNSGQLKAYRLGSGKHRRFRKRDVLQILGE
ncbi:MAG: helix-turn-helix domain-containing protein [bacterium]